MASEAPPDLKKLIWQNEKSFLTFIGIVAMVAFVVAYGAWQIYKEYSKYKEAQKKFLITYKPTSSDNYDIVKNNEELHYRDDTTFSQNLTRSLSEYKTYNERLKQFYKENRPEQLPKDIIDRSILDPKADKY
jgi:hypothetical protein